MDSAIITEYVNEIPEEVRDVINGLSEDKRMAIIVALLKNEKIAFTELKKLLDLKSSSLSYHLSLMQDGGLVDNIVDLKDSHSYYKATDIARGVLESLSNIVLGISKRVHFPSKPVRYERTQNTSGAFYPWPEMLSRATELEDQRISSEQQYPSHEASGISRLLPTPRTAAAPEIKSNPY